MGKEGGIWTKVALCCAGYGLVSNGVLIPIFSLITEEFSDANASLTNFVRTGNFIVSVPFALLTALLVRYISKRKLLLTSLVLFCLGGIGGAFSTSIEFLAVTRALDAASDGMATALVCSLISEIYRDEKTQSQVMGWQNGFACALGIVIGIPAGVLALYGWRYSFFLNCGSLISLVLVFFFVPETPPEGKKVRETSGKKNLLDSAGIVIFYLVAFFLIQTIYSQMLYMLGSIVEEQGLGTSVFSGMLVSIVNITMTATYAIFSPIYMKLKRKLLAMAFLFTGVTMILLPMAGNQIGFTLLVIGSTFFGAIAYPYCPMVIAQYVPETMVPFWMSVYTVVIYSASAVSSYVPGMVASVFGTTSIAGSFLYTGGFLVIGAVILVVSTKWVLPSSETVRK